MGSSFTDYRGRGFWARDADVELWLNELVAAVDDSADAPAWLREARDWWWIQATVGLTGCVSIGMDEHLAGAPDRESLFLKLVRRADERVSSYGLTISAEVANSFGVGGDGATFYADVDTQPLHAFAVAVADLVRGQTPGDVS